jgi:FtsP/CotA-like multicopper oxidase with cupredoxin domain
MQLTRRDLLKLGGISAVGAAGLTLPFGREVSGASASLLPSSLMPKPYQVPFAAAPTAKPYKTVTDPDTGKPKHYYDVYALKGSAAILPTLSTAILGYNWSTNLNVSPAAGLVPGPRIDVNQGEKVVMTMHNKITDPHPIYGKPVKISTHLHGSASLPQYDGYASDTCAPGMKKFYHYPNFQNARTLWYHDHGLHYTAENAYSGLAAQYHLHDERERALLPQGEFDVAVTLSDMMFAANGSQLYDDRTHSGLWGDVILVNGRPWPVMKVKKRIYRFRILNASISRSYRPVTSPAAPMYMVATDGGLMPKSESVSQWRHGSAERYEVLIDFSKFPVGQKIYLNNLSNTNNRDYDNTGKIMAFEVTGDAFDRNDPTALTVPGALNPGDEAMQLTPTSSMKVRNIRVQRDGDLWTLNGKTWDDVIASGYREVLANPGLGDTEIWEIQNNSGGWFHPVHIHLVDFKILSRNGNAPFAYEKGPKDVVYVGENETVRLIMKFGDKSAPVQNVGKYMIHCHNLPHEDHDMMGQFSVGLDGSGSDDNDPIVADPPCGDDDPREE